MNKEKMYKMARFSIVSANEQLAVETIRYASANNEDLLALLREGFGAGHLEIAELFEKGRLSLPELLYAAQVMNQAIAEIETALGQEANPRVGTVLLATVEGDAHDIGKGILRATLQTYGFHVIDLGRDVPAAQIVAAAEQNNADIIATSALLTTTLPEQKKLEDMLKAMNIRHKYKTMVGGAPVTNRWAKKIGADAYAEDPIAAVRQAKKLLGLAN